MARRLMLVLLGGLTLTGCAVHEIHKDHDLIRRTLLDLYTDQIMDNLVRARNGMPIIQLDYGPAAGQVTITNSASFSDNQAATITNVLSLPVTALVATRNIVTTLVGGYTGLNSNQVTLTATPLVTSNEVYDAYLEYLSLPGSLMVTTDRPPHGAAHIWRKCNGQYYWVPVEFARDFFRLSLVTTAQRGKTLLAPDEFYTVTLKKIIAEEPNRLHPGLSTFLTIELDKKIPADIGHLTLDADPDGTQYYIKSMGNDPSSETNIIKIPVANKHLQLFRNLPKAGKIYLLTKQPKAPTTNDLINRVNFQLQQIQLNQLRQGPF
jgi:hypothetical protein